MSLEWGARDVWIPPRFGERFEAGIVGARLVTFATAAHAPMEEEPDATAAEPEAFLAE